MIEIVLAILATYRLATMFATEEGPFGVFALIRERIDPQQETWLGRGLNCPRCVGFWVALACTCLIGPQSFVLTWIGIAGGQVVLQKWIDRWSG